MYILFFIFKFNFFNYRVWIIYLISEYTSKCWLIKFLRTTNPLALYYTCLHVIVHDKLLYCFASCVQSVVYMLTHEHPINKQTKPSPPPKKKTMTRNHLNHLFQKYFCIFLYLHVSQSTRSCTHETKMCNIVSTFTT